MYDLEIDEKEAEVVRLIFQKYVYEGYGAQANLQLPLCEHNIMGRNGKNIPNVSIVRMIQEQKLHWIPYQWQCGNCLPATANHLS